MQFQIQIVIEATDAYDDKILALVKLIKSQGGVIISTNPKPQVIQSGSRVPGSAPVAHTTGAHTQTALAVTPDNAGQK